MTNSGPVRQSSEGISFGRINASVIFFVAKTKMIYVSFSFNFSAVGVIRVLYNSSQRKEFVFVQRQICETMHIFHVCIQNM